MDNNIYVVDLIVRQVVVASDVPNASIIAAENSQAYIEANGFIHSHPLQITNIGNMHADIDGNTVPVNSQKTIAEILGVK